MRCLVRGLGPLVLGAWCLALPILAAEPWFGLSFADYAAGERLSDKGATGGVWGAQQGSATNAPVAGVNAMAVASEVVVPRLAFSAAAAAGEADWTFDARLHAETPWDFGVTTPEGPIAFTFVRNETSTEAFDFAGIVGGVWHRLAAAGVTFQTNAWFDVRVTVRDVASARCVGFSVRQGETYVPLASETGVQWFPADRAALAAIHETIFTGKGRFAEVTARHGAETEPLTIAQQWCGGAAGDWNVATNWSGGVVPSPGTCVKIAGTVTLTRDGETAVVSNLVARVGTTGTPEFLAGDLRTTVKLDASKRPILGKPLTVEGTSFCGVTPAVCVRWWRGATVGTRDWRAAGQATAFVPTVDDLEHWLKCEVRDAFGVCLTKEIFISRLPVLYLTTDDGATPSANKETHTGRVFMQGNETWKSPYDGAMTIKVRGNSSAGRPKKPWKIKLDEKTKLYDMPKSKHWVLLANWYDESLLRNKLAYDFANEVGSLGMKSTWVECVLNGSWQGCYQLCEQIRVEKNRVDIFDWEDESEARGYAAENLSWVDPAKEDITGGYLFEFDNYYDEPSKFIVTAGNLELKTQLASPEYLSTNPKMMDWCRTFIQHYADAITSPDGYSAEGRHYSAYCDIESMVAYFLVIEMFGNEDARCRSNYAAIDRGEKMKYGPVWDFDWGMGNYQLPFAPEAWLTGYEKASFTREWADDPWFCTLLWTRYKAARTAFVRVIEDGGLLDQHARLLAEAGPANDRLWKHDYGFIGGLYGNGGSHPGLKAYLKMRLRWLDAQFKDVPTLMASLKTMGRTIASTHPYAPDVKTLPMKLVNAPRGLVCEGEDVLLTFDVVASRATRVTVQVNGLKVGEPLNARKGRLEVRLPVAAFTADLGAPNCVALVAGNSTGKVLARNYALVTVTEATAPTVDAEGRLVPSVPYRWILGATEGSATDLSLAAPERLADALLATPSPWGKTSPLWQDYVTGTNPQDLNDVFRISAFSLTDEGQVRFACTPPQRADRVYTVWGTPALTTGVWTVVQPKENVRETGKRFFKVSVSLP